MSRIRGRNNRAEVILRKELWARGYRYRLYDKSLPGSPDIVFASARVAVMVDGDYWHGRAFLEGGMRGIRHVFRGPSRAYWAAKIKRNVRRDMANTVALRACGWAVVRLWERDVLRDVVRAANLVERSLRRRLRKRADRRSAEGRDHNRRKEPVKASKST